jgi:hypothetical protein
MKTFSEIKLKTILHFYIERRARHQDKIFYLFKKGRKNLFIFVMIARRDRLSAD